MDKTKRRAPKKENSEKSMFADLVYCADCNSKMWYKTNNQNRSIHFFACSNNRSDFRGTCPTRHYVRADAIEQVVTLELRRLALFLKNDKEALARILSEKTNKEIAKEKQFVESELQKSIVRNDMVAKLYEKLYEDNASGKVTDE